MRSSVGKSELARLPNGAGINIAWKRSASRRRRSRTAIALRWLGKNGPARDFSHAALARAGLANVLATFSVRKGKRVFALTDRIPELCIKAVGTLKHQ
jgi:acetyl-CoA synthetase